MSSESGGEQAHSGDPASEHDWASLKREALWDGLVTALAVIGGGVVLFLALQWAEGSDAATAGPWPVVLLYAIGGKWLVGGLCWAFGLFAAAHSVYRYLFTDYI